MQYYLKQSYDCDIQEIKSKDIIRHLKDKKLVEGQTVTIYSHMVLILKVIKVESNKIILKLED